MRKSVIASLKLARIAGVPIRGNWSVLVLVLLIAGTLSEVALPDAYPGYPNWAYDVTGILAALLFLLGLVTHELSHAIVAKRNGLEVREITLWMLGGVADVRGTSPGPRAEIRIFAIGPLASFLVGALFGGIAGVLALAGHTGGLVGGLLTWFAVIHLGIAALNLLPVTPLDGGRILRAVLWSWRGDRTQAALTVAWVGRAMGTVVIALGFIELLIGAGIGGLWLALLGWFMLAASSSEEYRTTALETLAEVPVRDVMTTQPQTVSPDTSVADFLDHVIDRGHNAFPLTEDGQLVALASLERVQGVPPERRGDTSLREVACPRDEITMTTPDESITDLLPRLNECADRRALVMSDDRLVGIVSSRDISHLIERRTPYG